LQVAVNREEFIELQERTGKSVIYKREVNVLNLRQQK
jgi:hypothetical protein